MKKKFVPLAVISLLCSCATMQTVMAYKGQGYKRTYSYSYNETFTAAKESLISLGLAIEREDVASHFIYATHGMSILSYGERIGVWFYPRGEDTTEVEVKSLRALSTNVFAKDWSQPVLDELSRRLP